ncbi:MAG: acyloxyacyl hydrolase [Gammaproteobacteria bacterium]|nr:acyloxyacyl hydrolase [Gammaproteobacteria bacterium]
MYILTTKNVAAVLSLSSMILYATAFAEEREEYEMLNVTVGEINAARSDNGSRQYGMEYRFRSFSGPWSFRLTPAIGFTVANDSAKYFYSDLKHDFYLSDHWLLTPGFGAGIFKDSDEIQLGSDFEFRSGLEFAYQFNNKVRAGLAVFHISNAGLSDKNPGTEVLAFSLSVPMGKN